SLRGRLTPEMYEALDTAVTISRLYKGMPPAIRNDFAGRILKLDDLRPTLVELDVAGVFDEHGYRIEWLPDLPGTRRAEFLAHGKELTIEVECKTESVDEGRKLERRRVIRVIERIVKILADRAFHGSLDVTVAKRMPPGVEWEEALLRTVNDIPPSDESAATLEDGTRVVVSGVYPNERRVSVAEIETAMGAQLDEFAHVFIGGRRDGDHVLNPIAVRMVSATKDSVVTAIFEDLKDARRQCSGKHPALICCHIPELSAADFLELRKSGALRAKTRLFFEKHAPEWVYAVSYSSEPEAVRYPNGYGSVTHSVAFRNPQFKSAGGKRLPPVPGRLDEDEPISPFVRGRGGVGMRD